MLRLYSLCQDVFSGNIEVLNLPWQSIRADVLIEHPLQELNGVLCLRSQRVVLIMCEEVCFTNFDEVQEKLIILLMMFEKESSDLLLRSSALPEGGHHIVVFD